MKKFMKYVRNHKGVTLVMMALMLVVLIALAALAIDISYMYLAKNATYVAADSAALAGAGLLVEMGDQVQQPARNEALKFAELNKVAGEPMTIASNSSNELTNNNDITLGYFNYTTREYTRTVSPPDAINAIEVRTRRTQNSPMGPVSLFLAKVVGWNEMGVLSTAIAGRPVTTGAPIALCIDACGLNPLPGDPPVPFYFKESGGPWEPPIGQTIAWTELSPTERDTELRRDGTVGKMLRGEIPMPNVCCQKIMTNNGIGQVTIHELPDKFEAVKAETGNDYWDVLVPIVGFTAGTCTGQTEIKGCPPGAQPTEPYLVSRYARLRIIEILRNPRPGILVSRIDCRACPADSFLGNHTSLLK